MEIIANISKNSICKPNFFKNLMSSLQVLIQMMINDLIYLELINNYSAVTMYKQPSLSKLSSRSLSKLKNKIDVAFSRQSNNENQAKNMQQVIPIRSNSTKSLAKSKYQSADRNLPFSTTIKNGLLQTQRKFSTYQTPTYASRGNQKESNSKKVLDEIECEKIIGYSWFHQGGRNITSVSKKSKDQNLRYFAMKQVSEGKQKKTIIAAIEDGVLYVGSKKYILVSPKMNKLTTKEQTQKIKLEQCPFVLVLDGSVPSFTNLHKFVGLIFQLIMDGVRDIDAITNIIGRKLIELARNSNKQKKEQMFILLILMEKKVMKLQQVLEK